MTTCKELPEFVLGSIYASVLRARDDGEYDLLATFNNSEGLLTDKLFYKYITEYAHMLSQTIDGDTIVTERQDAVDILDIDTETLDGEQVTLRPCTDMHPYYARQWLISNDREAAQMWEDATEAEVTEAVHQNLLDFGPVHGWGTPEQCAQQARGELSYIGE